MQMSHQKIPNGIDNIKKIKKNCIEELHSDFSRLIIKVTKFPFLYKINKMTIMRAVWF